eukprot:30272-Pelagococcus_subviridis.AAC.2
MPKLFCASTSPSSAPFSSHSRRVADVPRQLDLLPAIDRVIISARGVARHTIHARVVVSKVPQQVLLRCFAPVCGRFFPPFPSQHPEIVHGVNAALRRGLLQPLTRGIVVAFVGKPRAGATLRFDVPELRALHEPVTYELVVFLHAAGPVEVVPGEIPRRLPAPAVRLLREIADLSRQLDLRHRDVRGDVRRRRKGKCREGGVSGCFQKKAVRSESSHVSSPPARAVRRLRRTRARRTPPHLTPRPRTHHDPPRPSRRRGVAAGDARAREGRGGGSPEAPPSPNPKSAQLCDEGRRKSPPSRLCSPRRRRWTRTSRRSGSSGTSTTARCVLERPASPLPRAPRLASPRRRRSPPSPPAPPARALQVPAGVDATIVPDMVMAALRANGHDGVVKAINAHGNLSSIPIATQRLLSAKGVRRVIPSYYHPSTYDCVRAAHAVP